MKAHTSQPLIKLRHVTNVFGENEIHRDLDLDIYPGEIFAIIGDSGSGKTTLLRSMLMLLQPASGSIEIFNTDVVNCSEAEALHIKRISGMAFQQSALFSSLTVLENIMFPLREFTRLSPAVQKDLALLKLLLSGLPIDSAVKYPAQLSGGMRKRVAIARAIALDPILLFLDEPSAGLDPHSTHALGKLLLHLRDILQLTVVIVTHDMYLLEQLSDRVAFLGEKKVLAVASVKELMRNSHPLIQHYFSTIPAN